MSQVVIVFAMLLAAELKECWTTLVTLVHPILPDTCHTEDQSTRWLEQDKGRDCYCLKFGKPLATGSQSPDLAGE